MRLPLLLLLALPLAALAQYRPMYSPTYRPTYSPPPPRITPTPYQQQQQRQQQAHQNFQRMQSQQQQMMMDQMMRNQQHQVSMTQQRFMQQQLWARRRSPEQNQEVLALQQQAEQKATEQLNQLAQEQQRRRLEHPAADTQQTAAQQKEDARQLNLLTVKNYQEVFLPGQVEKALQAMMLSPKAQQDLDKMNQDLSDNAWWSKQDAAQTKAKLAAYGTALNALTADLLGYDITLPPVLPAAAPASSLDEMLAQDTFDQATATKIIQQAASAEKIIAGEELAKAVRDFSSLASSPELPADIKELRSDVKDNLRTVAKALQHYNMRVGTTGRLFEARKALVKSTSSYLKKNGK